MQIHLYGLSALEEHDTITTKKSLSDHNKSTINQYLSSCGGAGCKITRLACKFIIQFTARQPIPTQTFDIYQLTYRQGNMHKSPTHINIAN